MVWVPVNYCTSLYLEYASIINSIISPSQEYLLSPQVPLLSILASTLMEKLLSVLHLLKKEHPPRLQLEVVKVCLHQTAQREGLLKRKQELESQRHSLKELTLMNVWERWVSSYKTTFNLSPYSTPFANLASISFLPSLITVYTMPSNLKKVPIFIIVVKAYSFDHARICFIHMLC